MASGKALRHCGTPHIQMGDCGLRERELPQVARLASACENPEIRGTCNLLL